MLHSRLRIKIPVTEFGNHKDGDRLISTSKVLDTDILSAERNYPDIVSYLVTSIVNDELTCQSAPLGISAGDDVLIIKIQGTTTNLLNVGTHEILRVSRIVDNKIIVEKLCSNFYGHTSESNSGIGITQGTNSIVRVQRVPNYNNVTIQNATVNCSSFALSSGGICCFKAATITIVGTGKIDMAGRGYRNAYNNVGESIAGFGSTYSAPKFYHYRTDGYNTTTRAYASGGSAQTAGVPGNSGVAATSYAAIDSNSKLFMGGAGGHSISYNPNTGYGALGSLYGYGGAGGGIIKIVCHKLITSTLSLLASGANGVGAGNAPWFFTTGVYAYGCSGAGGTIEVVSRESLPVNISTLTAYSGGTTYEAGGTGKLLTRSLS